MVKIEPIDILLNLYALALVWVSLREWHSIFTVKLLQLLMKFTTNSHCRADIKHFHGTILLVLLLKTAEI